jgi:hypothetical protein
MKILFSFLFILFAASSWASVPNKTDSTVRNDYRKSLSYVLLNLNSITDLKKIAYVIPISEAEAEIYFSSDYTNKLSRYFKKMEEKIVKLSIAGNNQILTKYLYLSEFVDGYFAEDYFDDIEKIAKMRKDAFCNKLNTLNKTKTKRLNEIRAKYCQ